MIIILKSETYFILKNRHTFYDYEEDRAVENSQMYEEGFSAAFGDLTGSLEVIRINKIYFLKNIKNK